MLIVVMMQEKAKPEQSWVYMEFARNTPPIWIPIPNMEVESVRIVKMDGFLLTLQARNSSNVFYFDALARQLLDSPGQISHTATPAPTFLLMNPEPTAAPASRSRLNEWIALRSIHLIRHFKQGGKFERY